MAFDLQSFLTRQLATSETPSRRTNKNQSGRSGRKRYSSQQTLRAVGGYANQVQAIFAPPAQELCVVVPTAHVGWLPDGRPRREPRPGIIIK